MLLRGDMQACKTGGIVILNPTGGRVEKYLTFPQNRGVMASLGKDTKPSPAQVNSEIGNMR